MSFKSMEEEISVSDFNDVEEGSIDDEIDGEMEI
jgi:hypothetical protein